MVKKLIIEMTLVPESENEMNMDIVHEVFMMLHKGKCIIPWCDKVQKVVMIS